jgi:competence protein ComEC
VVYPHQFVATGGLSFLLGVLLASRWVMAWPILVVALILLGAVLWSSIPPAPKLIAVALLGLLLGGWRYHAAVTLPDNLVTQWAEQTVVVTGQVVSESVMVRGRQRFQLQTETIDGQPAAGKILLTGWSLPRYRYGDRLSLSAALTLPEVFDGFDYPAYLAKDGIYVLGQAQDEIELIGTPSWSWRRSLYHFKNWLADRTPKLVPSPSGDLINAILLGVRSELADDFKTALRNSGTTHIVALSGLHLTTVAGFWFWLTRRLRRHWTIVAVAGGIFIFVVMTGASASVVRAAVMSWVVLIAALWGRRRAATNAIILAATAMVAINPLILQYHVGFQLSLSATAGIIYLAPIIMQWLRRWPPLLQAATATTISATITTLPLVVFHFGGLSVVTLLANLLVIPLVPFVMLIGFITILLAAMVPHWQWLGLPALGAAGLLQAIINWFGHLPMAFVDLPPLLPLWPAMYYLVLVVVIYYRQYAKPIRL